VDLEEGPREDFSCRSTSNLASLVDGICTGLSRGQAADFYACLPISCGIFDFATGADSDLYPRQVDISLE
jgi:hypothetical protein